MKTEISIRDYQSENVQALTNIYYNTIHRINIQHYTEEQVDVWAPATSLETEGWAKKFGRGEKIFASRYPIYGPTGKSNRKRGCS